MPPSSTPEPAPAGDRPALSPASGHRPTGADAIDELRAAVSALLGADRRLKGRRARLGHAVPHAHLRALRLLIDHGEATAGALARATELNPASVTGMIDQLQRRGLLVRRRHDGDRRVCIVTLTEAGRRQVTAEEDAWSLRLRDVFGRTPPGELRAASRVLRRLAEALDDA